jgi:hypothetical protein
MNARDLITDAIVEKAARAEFDNDWLTGREYDKTDAEKFWQVRKHNYIGPMRVALEAVIGDLVGATRAADWDDPWGGYARQVRKADPNLTREGNSGR